jgi:hypothetical protein
MTKGGALGVLKGVGASWAKTWPKTNLFWAQTDSVRLKLVHTDQYMGSAYFGTHAMSVARLRLIYIASKAVLALHLVLSHVDLMFW